MKHWFYLLAALSVVAVGCTPKIARQPLTAEEQEWNDYVKTHYPAWKHDKTVPPGFAPTVVRPTPQVVVSRSYPQLSPAAASVPMTDFVVEVEEIEIDAVPDAPPVAESTDTKVEAQPADAKVEAQPADAKVEAQPADAKVEAQPADTKVEAQPADAKVEAEKVVEPELKSDVKNVEKDTEYVVQKGDTLGSISQKFYGKASLYPVIQKANNESLKGGTNVRSGMKLIIPKN